MAMFSVRKIATTTVYTKGIWTRRKGRKPGDESGIVVAPKRMQRAHADAHAPRDAVLAQ
ncbi:MAG: hypothetical protein ABI969_20475 [bacterium]